MFEIFFFVTSTVESIDKNDFCYLVPTTISTSNTTVTATTVTKATVSSSSITTPEVSTSVETRMTATAHENMDTSSFTEGIFYS